MCWSSPARIAAGQKWHAQAEAMSEGVTAALMQIAQVEPGMDVLERTWRMIRQLRSLGYRIEPSKVPPSQAQVQ
jgi:hypothetical protein